MNIKDYLNDRGFKTRKKLIAETGMSDRAIRDKISELKQEEVVVYNSQTSGYRLARDYKELSGEDLYFEILEVEHSLNDILARIDVFNLQIKTYEKWLNNARKSM